MPVKPTRQRTLRNPVKTRAQEEEEIAYVTQGVALVICMAGTVAFLIVHNLREMISKYEDDLEQCEMRFMKLSEIIKNPKTENKGPTRYKYRPNPNKNKTSPVKLPKVRSRITAGREVREAIW